MQNTQFSLMEYYGKQMPRKSRGPLKAASIKKVSLNSTLTGLETSSENHKAGNQKSNGSTNYLSVKELCEIPPQFRRVKTSTPKPEVKLEDTPEARWKAARQRAHDIAESCRLISERCRLQKNEDQLAEYHKQRKFYKKVEEFLQTKESKEQGISGKVTSDEKLWANIYMRTGIEPEKLAKEILRQRMLSHSS